MSDVDKSSKKIKKDRPKRAKKDPSAPKRPRSAYILFCTEHRPIMKEENPSLKPSELMRRLGEKWKTMSEEDKQPYGHKARDDKERFDSQMKNYTPSDEYKKVSPVPKPKKAKAQSKKPAKKGKKKKDPNEPKRAKSAYIFFGEDKREEVKRTNPAAKSPEIMKIIGALWRELTEEQKEQYKQKATQDKERYEISKAEYEKNKPETTADDEEDGDDDDEEVEEEDGGDDGGNDDGGDDDDDEEAEEEDDD